MGSAPGKLLSVGAEGGRPWPRASGPIKRVLRQFISLLIENLAFHR